jgi:ABC-type sugar transport system ATPase subunit
VRREVVARVDPGSSMTEAELRIEGVTKRFAIAGAKGRSPEPASRGAALQELTLSAERGEILVVVGPSGCGKSTALRIVAGLEKPDAGTVAIAGRPMNEVPPQDRDVAMVFQGYALYPQMTAAQILEFPLKMRGVPAAERGRVVNADGGAAAHRGTARPASVRDVGWRTPARRNGSRDRAQAATLSVR